jgi:hypothetical protein
MRFIVAGKQPYDYIPSEMYGKIVTPMEIRNKQPYYGVYVSRFLMDVDTFKGPFEEKVDLKESKKCKNKLNKLIIDKNLVYSNYILLPVFNISNTKAGGFGLGEDVSVGIIEQDIKSLFIKPYNPFSQEYNRPKNDYTIYVPASGKYGESGLNDDNTYFLRFDSDNQVARLHTSAANGESTTWDMMFDGGMGAFRLTDGKRKILIDSGTDLIAIRTADDKSTIAMRKGTINLLGDDFIFDAKKSMTFKSPKATVEIDDIKWTSKNLEGTIDMVDLSGTDLSTEYTKGTTIFKTTWDMECITASWKGVVSHLGMLGIGAGMTFGAVPGGAPLPTSPSASMSGGSDDQAGTFKEMNFDPIMGQTLMRFKPTFQAMVQIATTVDALASMFGVPPCTASLMALKQLMQASKVKG